MTTTLLDAALDWHRAGAAVIPAQAGKRPAVPWQEFQRTRPTEEQIRAWFAGSTFDGFGVITGAVSGNLEMFEFEGRARHLVDDLTEAMIDNGFAGLWERVLTGYREETPTRGLHLYYRVSGGPAAPNTKLASRPATPEEVAVKPGERTKVLIETRGEGGFTVVAPSGGRVHPTGLPWVADEGTPATIPTITVAERDALFDVARLLDQTPTSTSTPIATTTNGISASNTRPGDDFAARVTWEEILLPHGWIRGHTDAAGATYWTRPGKDPRDGISATTRPAGGFYAFTTSTEFEAETPYTKFATFAALEHGGDYGAAARDLAGRGYGDQRTRTVTTIETVPTAPQDDDEGEEEVFTATPIMAVIRQAARSRLVSPWAVLGCVLARVVAETPPHVVLPPTIGGDASLNLAVGLQARSGDGKSGAVACANDLLNIDHPAAATIGPGTGEGIIQTFLEWDPETKANRLRPIPHAFLYADEVGQIGAIQARNGATFGPIIRTMLTGGEVDTSNAEAARRRRLPSHAYRLTIVAGIQPRLAGVLLDDEDAGTPQRWVWLPAADRRMPDLAPEWPGPLGWRRPELPRAYGRHRMAVPEEVADLIRDHHRRRQRGQGDALDGHHLLTWEKVAAALALLHGETSISMDSWHLAGRIMGISTATRAECERAIADKADGDRRAAGHWDAVREIGQREARAEIVTTLAERLWRTVAAEEGHPNAKHAPGEGCTRRCLTFALRHHRGVDAGLVIEAAEDLDWIERRADERWWPGASHPAPEA